MTGPKLLYDENLSYRLVELLAETFPESAHLDDVGLHGCPDDEVWNYARKQGFVLVSKDNDFRQLSFLRVLRLKSSGYEWVTLRRRRSSISWIPEKRI